MSLITKQEVISKLWLHHYNKTTELPFKCCFTERSYNTLTENAENFLRQAFIRFQVLTEASTKFGVFWDVASCTHVEVNRRFRGVYWTHL
jgi:hypothetical protein